MVADGGWFVAVAVLFDVRVMACLEPVLQRLVCRLPLLALHTLNLKTAAVQVRRCWYVVDRSCTGGTALFESSFVYERVSVWRFAYGRYVWLGDLLLLCCLVV